MKAKFKIRLYLSNEDANFVKYLRKFRGFSEILCVILRKKEWLSVTLKDFLSPEENSKFQRVCFSFSVDVNRYPEVFQFLKTLPKGTTPLVIKGILQHIRSVPLEILLSEKITQNTKDKTSTEQKNLQSKQDEQAVKTMFGALEQYNQETVNIKALFKRSNI